MSITERLKREPRDAAEAVGLDNARLLKLSQLPVEADDGEIRLMAQQLLRYRERGHLLPPAPASQGEELALRGEDVEFLEVALFNAKFGLPTLLDGPPRLLTPEEAQYRFNFVAEENQEFIDAIAAGDLAKAYDALHDIVYVAKGTAHFMRCPWRPGWLEVQRANMEKEKGPSGKKRTLGIPGADDAFEVRKPPGWRGPDHERVLNDHVYVNWRTDG